MMTKVCLLHRAEAMKELQETKAELERQLDEEQRRMRGEMRVSPLTKVKLNHRCSIHGTISERIGCLVRHSVQVGERGCWPMSAA